MAHTTMLEISCRGSFVICKNFQNYNFQKFLSGIPSECQTAWIQASHPNLLSSADFFQIDLFQKIPTGLPSEWQTVLIQIRPDFYNFQKFLSGIPLECQTAWIQTSHPNFLSSADFFHKDLYRITIRVAYSLDPDQARLFVGPDLGPNCLQRLSADDTSRHRVKQLFKNFQSIF